MDNIFAMNLRLDTDKVDDYEKKTFLDAIQIKKIKNYNTDLPIVGFDVREDGRIVLVVHSSEIGMVYVLDSDGKFQYGYKFNAYGSVYVDWSNEDIQLYFGKGEFLATIDKDTDCIVVSKILTSKTNTNYLYDNLRRNKRVIAEKTYMMQTKGLKDMWVNGYTELICISELGEVRTLYKMNTSNINNTWFIFMGVVVFVVILIYRVRQTFKHLKK